MKTTIKWQYDSGRSFLSAFLVSLIIPASSVFFSASGQAGSLDLSFDGDGIVTTPVGNLYEGAYQVLLQPDGKIIAAGYSNSGSASSFNYDFAVVRYNPDGSLDNTFSGDGMVTTDFGSIDDYATSALLQPDGKIVVCGRTYINGNSDYGCALARYNSDGSLDVSFDGDGKVTYDINSMDEIIFQCALQPDGKILAAGYSYTGSQSVFAVLRFDASGSLDNSFGTAGVSLVTFGTSNARCYDVVLLAGGKILTLGRAYTSSASTSDFALAQLNTNGQLDNTFGTGGKVTTDFAAVGDYGEKLAVQPDGKIIAAGFTGDILSVTQFAMSRYTAAGVLDNTFGINGKVTTALTTHDEAYAIALQPDAKIILAGRVFNGANNDFGAARYLTDGSLDSTFDSDGKVQVTIGGGHDEAFAVALQPDGRIILGGRSENLTDDFALIRLRGDMTTQTEEISLVKPDAYMFPNPATNKLNFRNGYGDRSIVKIYDLSGRMVYTTVIREPQSQINIEALKPGIFLTEINNGSQSQTFLFTKINF